LLKNAAVLIINVSACSVIRDERGLESFLACDWSAVEKLTQCSSLNALALPIHFSNLVSSFEAIIIVHVAPNFT